MKQKIRFIINPISGVGKKGDLPDLIEQHLDHTLFDYDIAVTEYKKHAQKIAYDASLVRHRMQFFERVFCIL